MSILYTVFGNMFGEAAAGEGLGAALQGGGGESGPTLRGSGYASKASGLGGLDGAGGRSSSFNVDSQSKVVSEDDRDGAVKQLFNMLGG